LIFEGKPEANKDTTTESYYVLDKDLQFVKGFSIILVAFSYQQNLFPMFNSLKTQTNEECMSACNLALAATSFIYIAIALLGVFFFGTTIDQNILNNVSLESDHWESYMLRCIFLLVLGCHIPFIFFTGKESTLIIIDEWDRKSISHALEAKVIDEASSYMMGGEDLIVGPEETSQRRKSLAYKEMNITYYYVATLVLFYFEVFGACILNDIGLIFEFISAIAISALAFVFPGLFYLLAEGKFAT